MLLVIGIILLILAIAVFAVICYLQKENDSSLYSAISSALFVVLMFNGISLINKYFNPTITPIDVYRGKTTLEITYKDSIAIDSVVVWK